MPQSYNTVACYDYMLEGDIEQSLSENAREIFQQRHCRDVLPY